MGTRETTGRGDARRSMRGLMGMFTLGATLGCADTAATVSAPTPFRLRAPISNYRVPTSRPVLRWYTPRTDVEHTVTVCADRACQRIEETLTVRGNSTQPTRDLPLGVHYWRVTSRLDNLDRATPVWQFRTTWETDGTPRGTDRGDAADYNGDGYSDIAIITDDPRVEILYGGNGAVTSGFIDPGTSTVPGRRPTILGAADLDGDGFDDLAMGIPGTGRDRVVVFHGGSEGISNERRSEIPSGFPHGTWFVASTVKSPRRADLNQDGFDDLLLRAGPAPDGVNYTLGNAVLWREGGWLVVGRVDGSPLSGPARILLPALPADLNLDGIADLSLVSVRSSAGRFYDGPFPINPPYNPFSIDENIRPIPAELARTPLVACDLDRDRIDDVVVERQEHAGLIRLQYFGRDYTDIPTRAVDIDTDITCISGDGQDELLHYSRRECRFERLRLRLEEPTRITPLAFSATAWSSDPTRPLNARGIRMGNVLSQQQQSTTFVIDGDRGTVLVVTMTGAYRLESSVGYARSDIREMFQ